MIKYPTNYSNKNLSILVLLIDLNLSSVQLFINLSKIVFPPNLINILFVLFELINLIKLFTYSPTIS
jgi:hypothetical protein